MPTVYKKSSNDPQFISTYAQNLGLLRSARYIKLQTKAGKTYTDWHQNHGANILGHSPKPIISAISTSLDAQTATPLMFTPTSEKLASLLTDLSGLEHVSMAGSGQQAFDLACRLA